jgi:hypothetical protein
LFLLLSHFLGIVTHPISDTSSPLSLFFFSEQLEGYNSLVLVAAIAVLLGIIIIAVVFNKPNPTQQPEVQVLKDLSDYVP